jgi:hypothetical protein
MDQSGSQPIDYKTHILIGVRSNGVMTVISDWPHVPTRAQVQDEIDATRDGYVTFALCTPTSVITPDDAPGETKGRSRLGRLG